MVLAVLKREMDAQDPTSQAELDYKRAQTEKLRRESADVGGTEYGLVPVYGRDADGNLVVMQPGKDGSLVRSKVPEGVTPDLGVKKAEEAAGTARGKAQGEAEIGLPDAVAKADQSIALIDEMLAHPGRETATGLSSWIDPRNYLAGTDATDFNVRRDQLQGRAFLEAFDSLKGGGQITEVEGQKATDAIARLNTAQSDQAYVDALKELRGILELGKQRAARRAGGVAPSGRAPKVIDGYTIEEVP